MKMTDTATPTNQHLRTIILAINTNQRHETNAKL